jgi:hypothetical protein
VRSSGRIPKEIPILLIGSDLDGRVFSEPTQTVMLSLHGAAIFSCHKLSPEQELILRWPERNKESEIRVVGHIASRPGGHTYGVAFFDPHLNFWEIDFPPISLIERELGLISLVCTDCKTIEKIDDTSIEADVCNTNKGVIRLCTRCGTSTLWKPPAAGAPAPEPAPGKTVPLPLPSPPPDSASSFYAQPYRLTPASSPAPSPGTAVLTVPSPEKPAFAGENRRQHPRVRVNYSACIRHADRSEDIVLCQDMSKGGLCFKSRKRYYVQTLVEVAVPYRLNQPAIFVPAQIVFAEELSEQQVYRYGVAYLKPNEPREGF